ncbi:MAG: DUF983 domain-containing protein [Flavisolibacter sp.]|jgi:uncharacterized protein (DUF983 family)|nr:DUF983 domain-containing protein [Flavisolibacter sp.]
MKADTPHRSYISTVFGCYCPRCREGKLFEHPTSVSLKKNMKMHERCPVCGQLTDIEVGFYYGTGYVSYLIALVLTGITFVIWWLAIGFSFSDNRFLYWIVSNSILLIVLQPWLMRFSRSLWISWFVRYDPDWINNRPQDPERINSTQMNNW